MDEGVGDGVRLQ